MDRQKLADAQAWVREELKSSADFWLKNGMDQEHGGEHPLAGARRRVHLP